MICKMEHRWDEMEQCGIKVVKRRVGFRRTWREPVLMRTPTSPFNSEYPDEIIDIGAIVGEVMFQSSKYVIPSQRREKPRISFGVSRSRGVRRTPGIHAGSWVLRFGSTLGLHGPGTQVPELVCQSQRTRVNSVTWGSY